MVNSWCTESSALEKKKPYPGKLCNTDAGREPVGHPLCFINATWGRRGGAREVENGGQIACRLRRVSDAGTERVVGGLGVSMNDIFN